MYLIQKPDRLTTFGRTEVCKFKLHDKNYLQPTGDSRLIPAESGQGHRLMPAVSQTVQFLSEGSLRKRHYLTILRPSCAISMLSIAILLPPHSTMKWNFGRR